MMIDGEPTMTNEEMIELAHRLIHAKDQLGIKYNKVRELVGDKNIEDVCDNILAVKSELTRTKRALWLARAERAHWVSENADAYKDYCDKHPSSHYHKYDGKMHFYEWGRKWENAELKCRSYAEKFNEE